jgi:3-oxoacyl-[acyl-carrier protein] reductase
MRNIIVTGACGGIGQEVAHSLMAAGYYVWALDINEAQLREYYGEFSNCSILTLDLTCENEIIAACNAISASAGLIGGFVHCAGFNKTVPLYLSKQNDMESMFRIHVYSAMTFCSYIAKKGKATSNCSIVLISSTAAHEGAAGNSIYAAAKGALEGYLAAAASELAGKKVRINVIIPGDINTGMFSKFFSKMSDVQKEEREKAYPFGFGKPRDIANIVEFLISDKSEWITGQKIIIDGGHMCRML